MNNTFNILLIEMEPLDTYFNNISEFTVESEHWVAVNNLSDVDEKLSESVFDFVLFDCKHSDEKTEHICKKIRELQDEQYTSIVYLSSESTLEQRLKAYNLGVDDFIQKSITPSELRIKLNVCKKYHDTRRELIENHKKQTLETIKIVREENLDMNSLLSLYRGCLTVQTVEQLSNELKKVLDDFNLTFSLQIFTSTKYFHLRDDGAEFCPMEMELFQSLKENSRSVQSFGDKSYFQNGDVELMIHNMPVDDISLYGRLKDLLHLYLRVINDKNIVLGVLANAQVLCQNIIDGLETTDISGTAIKLNELKELIHTQDTLDNNLQEDIVFF